MCCAHPPTHPPTSAELSNRLKLSSRHSEIGPESFGIIVCRFVGAAPDVLGLVWPSFRSKSDSKSKAPGWILTSLARPFSSAEPPNPPPTPGRNSTVLTRHRQTNCVPSGGGGAADSNPYIDPGLLGYTRFADLPGSRMLLESGYPRDPDIPGSRVCPAPRNTRAPLS